MGRGRTRLLLESTSDELITRKPHVLGRRETLERTLVLERLLELLAVDDLVDRPLDTLDDDDGTLLHLLLLLLGQLAVALGKLLEILTGLVTLEHVLERGQVEVVVDVVESVLGNVSDDQVGVLPDLTTLVGLGLSDEELDEGRLSGSVGSENGDTRRERDLERDVVQLLNGRGRVLERDVTHLHERLLLGLDTVEEGRVREREVVVLEGVELVVRLRLGDELDERVEVTRVTLDLELVQVEDVGTDVVEESRVVRDDDRRARLERAEVVLEPRDVEDVQMVRRLIEEKDVGFEEDRTRERELHLPSSRERTDRGLLTLASETDSLEDLAALVLSLEDTLVLDDERDDRVLRLVSVDIVLDVEGADLVGRREALDLSVVDRAHERRLSRSVTSTKSVAVSTLETEGGRVQENLGTVREREGTVTEVLSLLLVGERLDSLALVLGRLLEDVLDDAAGRVGADRVGERERDVGNEGRLPLGGLPVARVAEVRGELSSVVDEGRRHVEVRGRVDLLDGLNDTGSELLGGRVAGRGKVGSVTGALGSVAEGLDRLNDDTTRFGVTDGVLDLDETGEELGDEGTDRVLVVDELGHVVNDDGDLTDRGSELLGETTREEGSHEGEGRGIDLLDEGRRGEELDRLGGLLDGVDERVAVGRGDHVSLGAREQGERRSSKLTSKRG